MAGKALTQQDGLLHARQTLRCLAMDLNTININSLNLYYG